jgi:hypothetical protein
MPREVKITETETRTVVLGYGEGVENGELLSNGYRVSVLQIKCFLGMGYTAK